MKSKAGLLQITAQYLTARLGLPEGCQVDAVFQTADDMASDTFTLRIRGAGIEVAEGCAFLYLSPSEILTDPGPG